MNQAKVRRARCIKACKKLRDSCQGYLALAWSTDCMTIAENLLRGVDWAHSWWRSKVPRDNEQKEANDSEIISDREVWSAIRYLDPEWESERKKSDNAAVVALLAI